MTADEKDSVLRSIRERFDYASREWEDIRSEGRLDMKAVAGDVWPAAERALRKEAKRPCLSLDELGQYVNQLINEIRQHKRSIKVTPIGNKSHDEIARLRANLIRQIEYRSNAQIAYTTMFENAVQRSYGYLRVKPRFESHRSFNQELIIEPFENPDMVTPDPDDLSPVGAEMKFCFVHEWWNIKDFTRRWPMATVKGHSQQHERDAPKWWRRDRVQVAEYWTIEQKERELLQLQTPDGQFAEAFADELAMPSSDENPEKQRRWMQKWGMLAASYSAGQATVINRRAVDYPYVCQYMTNGVELLPPDPEKPDVLKNPWMGTSIPIVACYGKVLWVDEGAGTTKEAGQVTADEDGTGSKRKIMSLVRLARDPAMLYAYTRTCEIELVGMTPKTPFIGYEGQFRGHETEWQSINHEPKAYLEARAMTDETGPNILPLPQRQPYDPAVAPLEMLAESARRAIQAAMGIMPLPTQAQRQNEKSGVALERIRDTSQQGSFHFVDHYEMALTRTGMILDELLPHYYDASRDVTIRDAAGEAKTVRINDPQTVDKDAGMPLMLTEDAYDVTLSTGPNYESEREEASEFADGIVQNIQAIAGIIGPQASSKLIALTVKLKNIGPIGDEIAETISPQSDGEPDAAQLQKALEEAQMMIQALQAELAEAQKAIETDAIKAQQRMAEADLKINADAQKAMAQILSDMEKWKQELEVKLEIELAKLGSAKAMARGQIEMQALHHHDEMALREQELATSDAQQTMDREAAKEQAEADRHFQSQQADKAAAQPESNS